MLVEVKESFWNIFNPELIDTTFDRVFEKMRINDNFKFMEYSIRHNEWHKCSKESLLEFLKKAVSDRREHIITVITAINENDFNNRHCFTICPFCIEEGVFKAMEELMPNNLNSNEFFGYFQIRKEVI